VIFLGVGTIIVHGRHMSTAIHTEITPLPHPGTGSLITLHNTELYVLLCMQKMITLPQQSTALHEHIGGIILLEKTNPLGSSRPLEVLV